MKCEQAQSLLVSYMNNEITPSERTLVRAHLSGCSDCQKELSLIAEMQGQISSALQHRAAQAVPSHEAWERLEARLTKTAQPSPANLRKWLSRLAPAVSRISTPLLSGGVTMSRNLVLTVLVVVMVIAIVVVYSANTVTPVSAKDILDHAYAAQTVKAPAQGIEHIHSLIYTNVQALAGDQGYETSVESYHDLQSGKTRVVMVDNKTGRVLDVFANDGIYTYSVAGQDSTQNAGNDPLTVYRSPQDASQVPDLKKVGEEVQSAKDMFDQMRNAPNVQLVGKETWSDGRQVYALQSQQPIKVLVDGELQTPLGLVVVYFDTITYETLGNQVRMEKDGQDILISSQTILANEVLPAGSSVAWDLSDLHGITIVDDPERLNGDLLPEIISAQDLDVKTQSAYLLKDTPSGFSLVITAPPKQDANGPLTYIATYRNEVNDYFVIQAVTSTDAENMLKEAAESYTTASGLTVHIIKERTDIELNGKTITTAIVEASDGVDFIINSSLASDMIKNLLEELVPVK